MESFPVMDSDGSINISDVLDAIETTDPSYAQDLEMMQQQQSSSCRRQVVANRQMPHVEIVEQPASKALRFRYECEGRSAGSIPGVNSTPENKTFPTIRIVGYKGRAMVVVSCVTKDPPYRPHPHNLVGKEVCKEGICSLQVSPENMTISFDKLGIQCIKRKDIEEALRIREKNMVDPFRTGFDHKRQPSSIDLNAVRLCFQVFLEGQIKGKFTVVLPPVVSEPIYDKKAMSDLVICKLGHCSASVAGGTEMLIFCEKVAKEDIQVRFFEERDGQTVWEGYADFQPTHVHKQVGIAFRTPKYKTQDIELPVDVFIQLKRPSDGALSDPLPFQFLPLGSDDPNSLRRKRQRFNNNPNEFMLRHVQAEAEKQPGLMNRFPPTFDLIKTETNSKLAPFGGPLPPVPLPPTPQFVPNPNLPNMTGLRPMVNSPRRTPSPMEGAFYNIPPIQQQPLMVNNIAPEPTTNFPSIIPNAIGNTINMGCVLDTTVQQMSDFDFTQFDNVDMTNLNISDIVKGEPNGDAIGPAVDESNMTDSFTKLTRNTIQELCSLNNLYKPINDESI